MGWVTSAAVLLCLLAAAAMPATSGVRSRDVIVMGVVFAAAVALSFPLAVSIGFAGLCVALGSGWLLLHAGSTGTLVCAFAGVSAACATALAVREGAPSFLAALVGLAVPFSATVLARRRRGFVTRDLRDEALLGLAIAAVCIAAIPSVNEGWQSALILNRSGEAGAPQAVPAWAVAFALLALAAGVARALWRRR